MSQADVIPHAGGQIGIADRLTSLVPAILEGDDDSVRALVELALPRLIRLVMSEGTSREDAEEAALEALFRALSRLPALDFDKRPGLDPFFSYLVTAALNSSRDRHRADERKGRTTDQLLRLDEDRDSGRDDDSEEEKDVEDTPWLRAAPELEPTSDGNRFEQLKVFLEALSPEDQLMLHLHAQGSLSSKEIGLEVGLKGDAVRQRVKRLHDRFRASVADEEAQHA